MGLEPYSPLLQASTVYIVHVSDHAGTLSLALLTLLIFCVDMTF